MGGGGIRVGMGGEGDTRKILLSRVRGNDSQGVKTGGLVRVEIISLQAVRKTPTTYFFCAHETHRHVVHTTSPSQGRQHLRESIDLTLLDLLRAISFVLDIIRAGKIRGARGGVSAGVLWRSLRGNALVDSIKLEVLGLACTLLADWWGTEDITDGIGMQTTRELVQFPWNTSHDCIGNTW